MNIEAILAEMRIEIRHIREDVSEMKEDHKERHDKADEGRARMHQRLDVVVERVGALEGRQSAVSATIADMKTVTDEVKRWKIMGVTSLSIAGIGAATLGVTFSDAIKKMLFLLGIRF